MKTKRPDYYMPKTSGWRWEQLSPQFVKQQRLAVLKSLADMDADLNRLGQEVISLAHDMRSQWAVANWNIMQGYEDRLLKVQRERKSLTRLYERLDGIRVQMDEFLRQHKWS